MLLITYDIEDPKAALSNTSIPLNFRPTTLWRRRQTTGGQWRSVRVTYSTEKQHSIVFSASPNPDFTKYRGFVAVDDITITKGPCESESLDAPFGKVGMEARWIEE